MKRFILLSLFFHSVFSFSTAQSVIVQYEAFNMCNIIVNSPRLYYTFIDGMLYIDEFGNEGFSYPYTISADNGKMFFRYYDCYMNSYEEAEVQYQLNGDIIIKGEYGSNTLLKRRKEVIEFGFD